MAVTAVIDIRVKGQSNLDKLKAQTEKIQRLIDGIKPIPSLFDTETARKQVNAIKEFDKELTKVSASQGKFRGTTASVNRQLGNLQSIFGNLTADTNRWRNALAATERAQLSLFQLEQKAMNQRAKTFGSRGAGKDIIPSVLGAGGSVAQSVEGLAAYRTELTRLRNSVKLGSKEYNELGAAIDKVNKTLSAKEGLAGLRQNLEQVSASQSKLLAINAGYVSQTLQVRKAEQALSAELLNRKKVLDAIVIAEQRAMGGSGGIIKRAGRGGLDGLRTALAEAEGIQSRMLTTEEGYTRQVEIVRDLQKAVNDQIAQRDLLMGKVNIKEEKSISLAQRLSGLAGNVGSAAVRGARPGRAIERRGLMAGGLAGVGGLGMFANTGVGQTLGGLGTGASNLIQGGLNIAGSGPLAIPGAAKAAKDIGLVSAGLGKVVATGKGVAALNAFNPAWVGAALLAWVTFGNKGLIKAVKGFLGVDKSARKVTKSVINTGKAVKETAQSVKLLLGLGVESNGMSHNFRLSADAAKKLGNEAEVAFNKLDAAYRKERLARAKFEKGVSTGTVLGGGFGSWSSKMAKEHPTGDARVLMERANRDRRDQMMITNAVEKANIRLVEVKGKQLDIDQRIERTLKNRGLQIQKNGKYLEKRPKNQGMKGMMSGFSGSKLGQGVLGGGFPMLFGGGPGAVGLGAVGGVLGGFAGGIGFSIIGGMVDRAVASIGQLGMAMNPLTADIQRLTEAFGLAGTEEGKRIATIEKLVGKEAALEAVRRRMVDKIGNANVQALEDFGKTWQQIVNNFNIELTKIAALVAKFAEDTGLAKWAAGVGGGDSKQTVLQSHRDALERQAVSGETEIGLRYRTARGDFRAASDKVGELRKEQQSSPWGMAFGLTDRGKEVNQLLKDANDELELAESNLHRIQQEYVGLTETGKEDLNTKLEIKQIQEAAQQPLKDEIAHLERSLQIGTKGAEQEKEAKDLLDEQNKLLTDKISLNNTDNLQLVEKRDRLKEQLEIWNQIKDTIAGGLTNAIMGLIDKTKTLAESLAGILKQIAQILIQKAITSLIDKIPFGGGGVTTGSVSDLAPVAVAAEGAYWKNGIKGFSTGGLVTRPTIGLIGEAGEDEYIIPSSKMQGAMERYSAGARGQGVIPGSGTVASGSGVRSTPTVVNYTGPVLSFNSEAYVPKSAIPEIINSAARRGAQEGQSKVFSQLKNSRSQRSRVGM